jgi:hypothetical protein
MKPSERVALGKALEELERPRARERQADGAAVRYTRDKTGDTVGAAIGMSRHTYERAKIVVEASEKVALGLALERQRDGMEKRSRRRRR